MSLTLRKNVLFILVLLSCSLSSGCQLENLLALQDGYQSWIKLKPYSYSFTYQYGCNSRESCADTNKFMRLYFKVDEENNLTIQSVTGAFIYEEDIPEEWHIRRMDGLYAVLLGAIIDESANEISFGKAGNIIQGSDFYISDFDYIKQPSLDKIAKLNELNKVKAIWESKDNSAYSYELNANCHYFECDGFNDPYLKARVIENIVSNVQALDHVTPTSFNKNVHNMEQIFAILKDEILRGKDSEYSYDPQRGNITKTRHYEISNLEKIPEWGELNANMEKALSNTPKNYILTYIVDCFCEPIHNFVTVRVENNRKVETIVNDVSYGTDHHYGLLIRQVFLIARLEMKRAHEFLIDYSEEGIPKFMHSDRFEYFEDDEFTYRNITLEAI